MNVRQFTIARTEARRTLEAALVKHLSVSRAHARRLVRDRHVRLGGQPCLDPGRRLTVGQRVEIVRADRHHNQSVKPGARSQSPTGPTPVVRFADTQVLVVDKPPGLTTVRHRDEVAELGARARRFLPPSLADLLPGLLGGGQRVRAVHRLDKETSGLVVFARTAEAERDLGRQFRAHAVGRRYLAIVRGRAQPGRIESFLVRDRGDGRRGSCRQPGQGQRTVTHVSVLEKRGDFTLVECRLETGRTHQVRIHLAEAGTPLCGERLYDRPPHGRPLPDGSGMTRPALHAASLEFDHPLTRQRLSWESPLPADMKKLLKRLRRPTETQQGDPRGMP